MIPISMQTECVAGCKHVSTLGQWSHEVRQDEDLGEIHTDDCGFFKNLSHKPGVTDDEHDDHDPGDFCTSGEPGVLCRVKMAQEKFDKDYAKFLEAMDALKETP